MAKSAEPKRTRRQRADFWVGLGASAGGLEALRGFVRNLPKNLPATYIVAQHMAPHHNSMLPEIIGRETDFDVVHVTDKLSPRSNTVYITPPNRDLVIEKGRLRLIEPSREPAAPKPSVDRFLRSLAEAKKDRAIGIVLSGTGSDGAHGIRAVRALGGITIAQDELTAKYTGMPIAAVETGCVDLVMSPEEIGAQFKKITHRPRDLDALKASPLHLDAVSELIQLLHDQTKANFRYYKSATFQRRVERRMAALNVSSLDDYVSIAKSSPKEVEALFRDLLISVTSFFRDPTEFEALKTHIHAIVKSKSDKKEPIRIWVPGTATGEEAYSLAILFADALGGVEAFGRARIQIFASDLDDQAIEVARRGFYPETALDEVPGTHLSEYFERVPTGYTVKKIIREKIVFSLHNVAQDPPFLNLDLISCRNVLIYFQASLQAQVFSRFHYAMVPNGVLFLGKSEAISTSESLFRVANPDKHIFYQRPSQHRKTPPDTSHGSGSFTRQRQTITRTVDGRDIDVANARFDSLVSALGPNALLITSDMSVRRAYGNVDRYISLTSGAVSTSVTSLLKEPYGQDVRAAVPVAIRKREVRTGIAHVDPQDPLQRERITVYPVESGPDEEVLALAVFKSWREETAADPAPSGHDTEARSQIEELTRELSIARTNLQQTVEELETSNEELQALNEELQSSNEELQSTNEELETSNEELQSTNEELSTVNEELQINSQELNAVNQSLRSILENVAIPMLVVDRGLNITNASRASHKVFGISADLNLPHISRCRLPHGYPDLVDILNTALESGNRIDRHINHDEHNAILTVVPHFANSGDMVGAIVLVTDNTEELKRTRNELQLIFDNIPAAITVRDRRGMIQKANAMALRLARREEHGLEGAHFSEHMTPESADIVRTDDEAVFESGEPIIGAVRLLSTMDGPPLWLWTSRILAQDPNTGDPVIYSIVQDITEQHEAEQALKRSEERLALALRASEIGLWDWNVSTDDLYWSDRFKEIIGVNDKTFGGRFEDFSERLHPDDRDRVLNAVNHHLYERVPYDIEYRLRKETGIYAVIEARGQATWNEDGEPFRFTGTVADVSERHASIRAQKERNEQLALAARLAGIGYWKIDLTDNSLFWSDQIFEIHGVSPKAYQPDLQSAINFYHPDDVERVTGLVEGAIKEARAFEFEARLIQPSGDVRHVRSICTPDVDREGHTVAVFGVFRDVSEDLEHERQLKSTMEELSRSNEELNRFSYVCSHDMKEPVRLIESMSALLLDPGFDADAERRRDLLSRISNNTVRLRAIIDSLLAYSRIEATVEKTEIDLNAVLVEIREGLSLAAEEKQANLDIGKLPTVRGARVHFTQLFQNLIGNALKFNDSDDPVVKVRSRKRNGQWVFSVEDNGPGIAEEWRKEIFGVFRRLNLRDEIDGTGLGLSICQRIVHQYGGSIKCTTSKLGGAKFEFEVPGSEKADD